MDPHQSYPSSFFAKKNLSEEWIKIFPVEFRNNFLRRAAAGVRWNVDDAELQSASPAFLTLAASSERPTVSWGCPNLPQRHPWPGWESFMAPMGFSLLCCDRTSVSGGKTEMHVAPRISASDWLYRLKCSKAIEGLDWNRVEIEMKVNLWTLQKSTAHQWS